jgi:hypothetical protein
MKKNLTKTILLTGLFVGTTDILYAFIASYISSGKFSEKMFQYIAAGLIGIKHAMAWGTWAAFIGLFIHYFIAMAFTVFFFLLFPRIKILSYNKFLVGMLYAIFVNLIMNFLVLPLTTFPAQQFNLSRTFIDWIIFGCVFGIPIAWNAYGFYTGPHREQK